MPDIHVAPSKVQYSIFDNIIGYYEGNKQCQNVDAYIPVNKCVHSL